MKSTVRVGQIWKIEGKKCVVVMPNDSMEAGKNSWVMRCVEDIPSLTGKTLYMHDSHRSRSRWKRVPLSELLMDAVLFPEEKRVLQESIKLRWQRFLIDIGWNPDVERYKGKTVRPATRREEIEMGIRETFKR